MIILNVERQKNELERILWIQRGNVENNALELIYRGPESHIYLLKDQIATYRPRTQTLTFQAKTIYLPLKSIDKI
jgi:hypothetical protein